MIFTFGALQAQPLLVTNDPPITPENLITNIFLGEGVEVLSVDYEGSDDAVGLFRFGEDEIGLERGIVLTTGLAVTSVPDYGVDAIGANFASENNNSTASDPDLNAIASNTVNNVTKYTITFIPIADTLRFRYAFASEEYPEFACTQYNDVFGFFISGPGINGPYENGGENIALIPGTDLPVTINNVNPGVPGSAGGTVGNCSPPNGSLDYSGFYNDNNNANVMPVYDGITDVFTAEAIVQPCNVYTIKLLIADVGDTAYDSGVFLEAKSFGTGALKVDINTVSVDGSLAEGCDPGFITFFLPEPVESDYAIDYNISGTATNGVDYDFIPDDLFIPAGDSAVTIPVVAFEDMVTEGEETLLIDVQTDPCNRDTFEIILRENPLVPPDLGPDLTICPGDSVQLAGAVPITTPPPPSFTNDDPLFISTDNQPFFSDIDVSGVIPDVLGPEVIQSVCIDSLEHRWIDDLDIFLISPGGQFLELSTDNGGNGGNNLGLDYYLNTCFTVDATTPINFPGPQAGPDAVPFTGEWLPEGIWSDLWDGAFPSNGTWRLQVLDDAFNVTGTLFSWTITFNPTYEIAYSWTPATGLSCTDCPDPVAAPTETTTYILTANDTYGCSVSDTITIVVEEPLASPVISCGAITENSITFNWDAVPGAAGYEVQVDGGGWIPSNGAVSHTVTGLSLNQSVTIEVRPLGGCGSEIGQATCQTPDCTPPSLSGTSTSASCVGIADGSITLSATGGAPPYSFTVAGVTNTTGVFDGLPPDTYTAVVVDANDCPGSLSVIVEEADALVVDSLLLAPTSCYGLADGAATVLVSGGTPPYAYAWNSGEADSVALALTPGLAEVTVTDANGCQAFSNLMIPQPDSLVLTLDNQPVSCNGAADGFATVAPAGGVAPYAYLWDAGGQVQDTAFNLSGGAYGVTVIDANGCQATGATTVEEAPPIELDASGIDASCYELADGAATATASGGTGSYTYTWSDSQTGPQAENLAAGPYYVIVTDEALCVDTASVTIGQPDSLSFSVDTAAPSCNQGTDGSATLTVSGGTPTYAFQWSDQPVPQDSPSRDDLLPGAFSVIITDGNGCSTTVEVEVPDAPPIEVTLSSTVVSCNGGADGTATAVPSGGAGGFTYQWDNNDLGATAAGLSAGQVSVTVTDANGCEVVATTNIEENAELVATVSTTDPLCNGSADGAASVSVEGGTAPYSYDWSNSQNTPSADGLAAGFHQVDVTDDNGCTTTVAFSLGEPAPLSASLSTTLVSCDDLPDGTATAAPTGGTSPYTYSWSDPAGQSEATAEGLLVGPVTVTVTDANGCTFVESAQVGGVQAIALELTSEDVSCYDGNDGAVAVAAVGGSGAYTYSWSDSSIPDTETPAGLTAGLYTVTVTDQSGCFAIDSVAISQPEPLVLSATPEHLRCAGLPQGAIALEVTGGVPPFSYIWSNGEQEEDLAGLPADSYEVTVTDENGCTAGLSVAINEPPPLELNFEVTPVDCYGEATGGVVALPRGGVGNYSLQWPDGGAQPERTDLPAGDYTVVLTDDNGCELERQVVVPQPEAPLEAEIQADTVSCYGFRDGRITVLPTGGTPFYQYSIDGGPFTSSPVFIGLEPGFYNIQIRDVKGCEWSVSGVEVMEPQPIVVDLGPDLTIKYGDTTTVEAIVSGGVRPFSYLWSPYDSLRMSCEDCFDPLISVLEQTSFRVEATDANGCTGEEIITIFVSKERRVFVPTGFTPNGDGANDRLLVHGEAGVRIDMFRVFDRWGELLFEASDFDVNDEMAGWDGSFRGSGVEGGVYIWQMEVTYPDGSSERLSGSTTLIR